MMQIDIFPMSVLEYIVAFAPYNTPFSTQCVNQSAGSGLLFQAKKEKRSIGYLCAVREPGLVRITYAFTVPEYRNTGVFTALADHLTETSESPVRISVLQDQDYSLPIAKACQKLQFLKGERVHIFTCRRENYPLWEQFMNEKGNRLCSFLERKGYRAVSFADADEDLLFQLRNSRRSDYGNAFDPSMYLDIPENRLSWDMSHAVKKEGRLASYTLVTQNSPTKVVFEQISESAAEQGTGVVLLSFAAAMKAFGESECQTVSYAMYESNTRANAFRESILMILSPTVSVSENYFYIRPLPENR